jgi:hypothetical protein
VLRCSTLFFTGLTAVSIGCGGATETTLPRTNHPNASLSPEQKAAAGLPPMIAHRFAEVTDVVGPYVGRDGDVSLAGVGRSGAVRS